MTQLHTPEGAPEPHEIARQQTAGSVDAPIVDPRAVERAEVLDASLHARRGQKPSVQPRRFRIDEGDVAARPSDRRAVDDFYESTDDGVDLDDVDKSDWTSDAVHGSRRQHAPERRLSVTPWGWLGSTLGPAVPLAILMASMLLSAPAAHAQSNADYDSRNGVTLGDAPYRSAADLVASRTYDTTAFGESEEYGFSPNGFAACDAKGARTAWVRFNTAVAGRLFVSIDSAARPYDVFTMLYTAPNTITPGSASIGDLHQVDCYNGVHGGPNESYTFGNAIPAGSVVYIQTLSVCADRSDAQPCDANERAAAAGGPTTLNVRFDPDDSPDEDGVPNPLDVCPNTPGVVDGSPADGCPDADMDGVTEPGDACPGVTGHDGHGCRKPDEDGDGYVDRAKGGSDCNDDNAAINPGAMEQPGNNIDENCDGRLFRDRDGDNFDDDDRAADCDATNAKINRGATEVAGNRVDENCDGVAQPYPALQNVITPGVLRDGHLRTVGFTRFTVANAPKGMTVTVTCDGQHCPYGGRGVFKVTRAKRKLVVATAFEFRGKRRRPPYRVLPVGTKVTVLLSQPGHVGKALRYTIRARGSAGIRRFCTEAGSSRLHKEGTCGGYS